MAQGKIAKIAAKRKRRERTVDFMLTDIPTCELVKELSKREGVEKTIAEPYQDVQVKINGPAIVLVVID